MKISMTVCNVCQDPTRPTLTYAVTKDGGRRHQLDLCEEHGAPIDDLLDGSEPKLHAAQPQRRRRTGGTSRTPMLTLEEIEERKKAKAK